MFFVIDKPRLQRVIAIVRDDRTKDEQGRNGPFLRIEASANMLKLTGRIAEGEFPATVYEPGVLFLRITRMREALAMISGEKTLAIQVNEVGLLIDNMRFPLETNDMLLYPNPATAPRFYPGEVTDLVAKIDGGVAAIDELIARLAALKDRLESVRTLELRQQRIELQNISDDLPGVAAKVGDLRETLPDKARGTLFEVLG